MSFQSIRRSVPVALLLASAAMLPPSLHGQAAANAAPLTTADAPHLAALRYAPAGITTMLRVDSLDSGMSETMARRVNAGPNVALMGTGAAAVVVGLMVGGNGGTIIALGGGVVGLVGLYRFLR